MQINTHTKHGQNVGTVERTISMILGGLMVARGLRHPVSNLGSLLAGGELLRRGATGHCLLYSAAGISTVETTQVGNQTLPYNVGIRVDRAIVINRSREDIYRFWKDLTTLGRIFPTVESIETLDEKRSHWKVQGPGGSVVEWTAEIINDIENELIAWKTTGKPAVQSTGSVHFKPATGGRGTMVQVELQYNPPGGAIGAAVAKLFGKEPTDQIQEALRALKKLMETGEIITVDGQSAGPRVPPVETAATQIASAPTALAASGD